jgi:hypothetical protein
MPQDLGPKKIKLQWSDIQITTRHDWRDKRDIHMLMNIHNEPPQVNFHDEQGNAMKPFAVDDCNHHMAG